MKNSLFLIAVVSVMSLEPAFAYTGPGLGAATIAVVVGFFTSIFVALFAVIWYPVKRLLKNRKKADAAKAAASCDADALALKADDGDGAKTAESAE